MKRFATFLTASMFAMGMAIPCAAFAQGAGAGGGGAGGGAAMGGGSAGGAGWEPMVR